MLRDWVLFKSYGVLILVHDLPSQAKDSEQNSVGSCSDVISVSEAFAMLVLPASHV